MAPAEGLDEDGPAKDGEDLLSLRQRILNVRSPLGRGRRLAREDFLCFYCYIVWLTLPSRSVVPSPTLFPPFPLGPFSPGT